MKGPGVKKLGWRATFGVAMIAATVVLMVVHYLVFRDLYNLGFYSVHALVMMPAQALLLTLLLNEFLTRKSRQEMLNKLSMVIGAFFTEVGSDLLRRLSCMDATCEIQDEFRIDGTWDHARYEHARQTAAAYRFSVRPTAEDLAAIREFLVERQPFILGMLQNPNLLEHERFTDVLWAVSHLTEELRLRGDVSNLPGGDVGHLVLDIQRAYAALALQWLDHAEHLQTAYPYLFSLVVRMNPLDPNASPIVRAA